MNAIYKPPIQNILFSLFDVNDALGQTAALPGHETIDKETVKAIATSAADFSTTYILPLNATGDKQGCTHNPDQSVTTPKGFQQAYNTYSDLGFPGLSADPAHGGQGLPHYINTVVNDVTFSGNLAFMICPALTAGAACVLEEFGSEELKATYLPSMNSGEAAATMCLTEPDAGTDLSLITSKAVPQEDGSHTVTGEKIFISFGEHDLTENIYHLVLARLPDAPKGTKGLSLFLVPKIIPENGERNNVTCAHVEEKMGIHASPTCQMSFDNAKGWMIGEPNKGFTAMFKMMNDARLKVSQQGLSLAEIAYQNATKQAATRVQGRPISAVMKGDENAEPVPIIKHNNIKRDLMEMRANIDGGRFLIYSVAVALDKARKHPDPAVRKEADDYASLMTPVTKTLMTDLACDTAQRAIQIHGGMGFIKDTGVEQFYRDAIIGTIYEGTNDVQAMDFMFRKASDPRSDDKQSERLKNYATQLEAQIADALEKPHLASCAKKMQEALDLFSASGKEMLSRQKADSADAMLVNSYDYTTMFGQLAVGGMWLKVLDVVTTNEQPPAEIADFYKTKEALGRYYLETMLLPDMGKHHQRIQGNSNTAIRDFPMEFLAL